MDIWRAVKEGYGSYEEVSNWDYTVFLECIYVMDQLYIYQMLADERMKKEHGNS